jgi:thiosulfate dehydrogenase [quinone] large subunit
MNSVSFLLLRLAIGASFFGHGLVRLPKLHAFSGWMVGSFQKSMLPEALVTPFSYALPVAEFIVGLLLLAGLFTRSAAIGGSIIIVLLIFGTCLIENWEALTSQLVHLAFLVIVLQFIQSNSLALDRLIKN